MGIFSSNPDLKGLLYGSIAFIAAFLINKAWDVIFLWYKTKYETNKAESKELSQKSVDQIVQVVKLGNQIDKATEQIQMFEKRINSFLIKIERYERRLTKLEVRVEHVLERLNEN